MTTAQAHPNIALVKYWGKQTAPGNTPATPSLSITLSNLATTTRVEDADEDVFFLNGNATDDRKVTGFLAQLRQEFAIRNVTIHSSNNFPTSAGLASSASGFAALMVAINEHCGLALDDAQISGWARRGSASAARSIFGGFVTLEPPVWQAQRLAPAEHWDLRIVVAITSTSAKQVGSTEGMERSRTTSPYYPAWVATAGEDFRQAQSAICHQDFTKLADIAEYNCMKMHGLMLSSRPALSYWNAATLSCMDCIRDLRAAGTAVFFTNDAGPQLKAVCLPDAVDTVAANLRDIAGVEAIMTCELGADAALVDTPS